jgi:hypothetical protein
MILPSLTRRVESGCNARGISKPTGFDSKMEAGNLSTVNNEPLAGVAGQNVELSFDPVGSNDNSTALKKRERPNGD